MLNPVPRLLDWLYPRVCVCCGESSETGLSLCKTCLQSLPRLEKPLCLHCGTPLSYTPDLPDECEVCRSFGREFDFARSALLDTPETRDLVISLKYRGALHLASLFAYLLDGLWEDSSALRTHETWGLVPVPMTFAKLHRRGYNQAEEIARDLAKRRGFPVLSALTHLRKDHASQTFLDAVARAHHAREVYHASPRAVGGLMNLPPHLLVIDDVWTTGATARACALRLKKLPGVQTVGVLTALRVIQA